MSDNIKIKDLPRILHANIANEDLMPIDCSGGTYSITVGELLVIFSADNKILALQDKIQKALVTMSEQFEKNLTELANALDTVRMQVTGQGEWQEQAKTQIMAIQKSVADLEASVSGNTKSIENINSSILEISAKLSEHLEQYNTLKELVDAHTESIDQIESDIAAIPSIDQALDEYIELTNKTIEELKKSDTTNKSDILKTIDEKYDDIMKYIDYYHHCEETPPNFDEPYYWEKELVGYCYPIHSLYHTTEQDWDPQNYRIPGEWTLRSTTALTGGVTEYIYERTS